MSISTEIHIQDSEPEQRTFSSGAASVTFLAYDDLGKGAEGALNSRTPILVKVSAEDGYWCAESDEYDIYTSGETREAAVDDFMDHLRSMYFHYLRSDDQHLAPSAIGLKAKFLRDFVVP